MVTQRGIVLVFTLVLLITFSSSAQQVYFSNEGKGLLQLLDLNSNPPQVTTLYTVGAKLDDLILNSAGQLIYSVPSTGVNLYDPTTGQNTELVSGLKSALDLIIEPGGQTMLIAVHPGQIVRYNFATGATTVLLKEHETFDGIAYDPYGNLYAVAGHNTIIQINPVTGAILNTLVLEPHHGINGGDGMTYDSYTGSLWATHAGTTGNGLLQIPVTAAGLGSTFSFYPTPGVSAPDGIKSDGKGNLYIGAIWTLAVYNIPTNTITQNVVVKGADGVSLVPGTY
jgi:sugar lactone lactonase YvrE